MASITSSLTHKGSAVANVRGCLRTGSAYVGNLHLQLKSKGDTIRLPGTSACADLLNIHANHPSRPSGDAQSISSIEGPSGKQVEELWV